MPDFPVHGNMKAQEAGGVLELQPMQTVDAVVLVEIDVLKARQ